MSHKFLLNFITTTAYFGPFLIFTVPFFLWFFRKIAKKLWPLTLLIILSTLFLGYMRFVEPQMIRINHQEVPKSLEGFRFVLISDLHMGLYKRGQFLDRAVTKILELDTEENPIDFILIAGDLVYQVDDHLAALMEPLGRTFGEIPIYAVLGNHDLEPAGELSIEEGKVLESIWDDLHVQAIDNRVLNFKKKGQTLQIIGFGELWNHAADLSILEQVDPALPSLGLVHNPDLSYDLTTGALDLLLAGHTHGGQIRIPFLYPLIIPTHYDFGKGQGWYEHKNPLFITTGLGESGLPLRLGVPPEIVIFE